MAIALIQLLAWEPPYAVGVALKRPKKKKKKTNIAFSHKDVLTRYSFIIIWNKNYIVFIFITRYTIHNKNEFIPVHLKYISYINRNRVSNLQDMMSMC